MTHEWPVAHVLHLLRNPYGHTEDELRAVRLYAADLIEELLQKKERESPQGAPEPLDAVGGDSAKISFPVSRR